MAQSPSIKREKWIRLSLTWLVVILVSVVIIYPLVWTVGASLNAGNSLLSTSIIPEMCRSSTMPICSMAM